MIPARPSDWQHRGRGQRDGRRDGGWIALRDRRARGCGHVRLIGGKAWTLLTTMTELKGHEERRGPTRDGESSTAYTPAARRWLERRRPEEAELGYVTQPYVRDHRRRAGRHRTRRAAASG